MNCYAVLMIMNIVAAIVWTAGGIGIVSICHVGLAIIFLRESMMSCPSDDGEDGPNQENREAESSPSCMESQCVHALIDFAPGFGWGWVIGLGKGNDPVAETGMACGYFEQLSEAHSDLSTTLSTCNLSAAREWLSRAVQDCCEQLDVFNGFISPAARDASPTTVPAFAIGLFRDGGWGWIEVDEDDVVGQPSQFHATFGLAVEHLISHFKGFVATAEEIAGRQFAYER